MQNNGTGLAADLQITAETPITDDPNISIEKRTPLEVRLQETRPELIGALKTLKEKIGEESFNKFVEPLNNVTRSGGMLLLVAEDLRQKSLLERDYIPQIKETFEVQVVRIVV